MYPAHQSKDFLWKKSPPPIECTLSTNQYWCCPYCLSKCSLQLTYVFKYNSSLYLEMFVCLSQAAVYTAPERIIFLEDVTSQQIGLCRRSSVLWAWQPSPLSQRGVVLKHFSFFCLDFVWLLLLICQRKSLQKKSKILTKKNLKFGVHKSQGFRGENPRKNV